MKNKKSDYFRFFISCNPKCFQFVILVKEGGWWYQTRWLWKVLITLCERNRPLSARPQAFQKEQAEDVVQDVFIKMLESDFCIPAQKNASLDVSWCLFTAILTNTGVISIIWKSCGEIFTKENQLIVEGSRLWLSHGGSRKVANTG